jgi:hypothetical protein
MRTSINMCCTSPGSPGRGLFLIQQTVVPDPMSILATPDSSSTWLGNVRLHDVLAVRRDVEPCARTMGNFTPLRPVSRFLSGPQISKWCITGESGCRELEKTMPLGCLSAMPRLSHSSSHHEPWQRRCLPLTRFGWRMHRRRRGLA